MRVSKRGEMIVVLAAVFNFGFAGEGSWHKSVGGILEPQINSIFSDPDDSTIVYAGTDKALYISTDQGHTYHSILQVQGSNKSINHIYKPRGKADIFVATGSGIYASGNRGLSWEQVFSPGDDRARQCFAVFKESDVTYAGTQEGLYYKKSLDSTWHRESGDLGNEPIYTIAADPSYIYFAGDRRIFRKKKDDDDGEIKVIFDAGLAGEESEKESTDEEEFALSPRPIKDFEVVDSIIFVANDGVSFSTDQGQTWQALPTTGLTPTTITALTIHKNSNISHGKASFGDVQNGLEGGLFIYAGTIQGVFKFTGSRWIPLYKGMETNAVNDLVYDPQDPGVLYAATSQGVFYLSDEKAFSSSVNSFAVNPVDIIHRFDNEPSIQEVQRLAIDYAEVHPEKIKQWRSGAQYRALLPTLSAGLDRDATELFHWDSGGTPDKLLEGRDLIDWDISVSWDLADLIWNPDQTSIDSRSKLMVELREDIMDQVTRLYFERRRVQVEKAVAEASGAPSDPQLHFDRQMRVDELTALIDALTGGKFSQKIKE